MTTKTTITRTCDKKDCGGIIDAGERYVSASTYGAEFHELCLIKMTAFDLIKALGLDEIKLMVDEDYQTAEKLCYKQKFE